MPGAFPFPPHHPEDENPAASSVDSPGGDTPVTEQSDPSEAASVLQAELPPEARGETNGGPLGCCLGITVGIMLCLFLGVIGFGQLLAAGLAQLFHADIIATIRFATGLLALAGAMLGGFLGWKIGKRVYREYELSPRRRRRLEKLEKKYQGQPRQQIRSQQRKI
jgi:hypothetical protein